MYHQPGWRDGGKFPLPLTISVQTKVNLGSFRGHKEGTQDPLEMLPAAYVHLALPSAPSPNLLQVFSKSKLAGGGCQPDMG